MRVNYQTTRIASEDLNRALGRGADCLLSMQRDEGYWWGELESNPTMEAEYLMLLRFLGIDDPDARRKLRNQLLHAQREDGTWGQFYGAPGDLSASIECYFALKLAGVSADDPRMAAPREFILSKGGVVEARVFTKIWLSLFGQYRWSGVPVLPPELMLLPNWFPINLYEFSSWARATIVPLLVLFDRRPVRSVPPSAAIAELYVDTPERTDFSIKKPDKLIGWESFFYAGDAVLRQLERLPWKPTRAQAIRKAERWIVERQDADGSWGGIQPPWVYSLMALSELGYDLEHPVMKRGLRGFDAFKVEDGDRMRVQACVSPVWDTCLALIGLLDAGVEADHPSLAKAGEWLIRKQILTGGDWQVKAPDAPPGGWAFEFHNAHYPDMDDTAEIAMALDRLSLADEGAKRESIDRAARWLLGMQSSNGGWAAFDKNNTRALLAKMPFSDFGETIDPPSVDVTAHILETLGQLGYDAGDPRIAKALDYVFGEQEEDGAWFGRWGVNYIYGTGAVLPALKSLGIDMGMEPVNKAARWLAARQNADGGWGESCVSYVDPSHRGRGPSAPSQTAWALLALLAAGRERSPEAARGIGYLIETQRADGSWDEPYYTGAGFPGYGVGSAPNGERVRQGRELPAGFMIKYDMYPNYWPLMALGRYKRLLSGADNRAKSARMRPAAPPNSAVESPPGNGRARQLRRLPKMW